MIQRVLNGFSLIEVLIAIAIVALIAIVSLPLFSMGLRNVKNSEEQSNDLFDIQSKIESGNTSPSSGSPHIIFNFPDGEVIVPIDEYEIMSTIDGEEIGDVSIFYFEFDSERDN